MTKKHDTDASTVTETLGPGEQWVPVAEIHESEDNGRLHYDEAEMRDLAQSIQGSGLKEALKLRPRDGGGYELVDGHRRFRALQRLQRAEVRCTVEAMSVEEARIYRVATMFHKNNGTPYEQARYLAMALKNPGMTRQKLSQVTGIKPGTLRNRLELMEFPEEIGKRVGVGDFSVEHARILASLAAFPEALEVGLRVADEKEKGGGLRSAPNFFEDIKKALVKANLGRDPGHNKYWDLRREMPTFEGQAEKLAKVAHKTTYREESVVLDVAAFDALVEKGKAMVARRKEKEAKQREDPEEVRRRKREERQYEVDRAARQWQQEAVRTAAYDRIAGLKALEAMDLALLLWDLLDVGLEEGQLQQLSAVAGVAPEALQAFLGANGGDPAELALLKTASTVQLLRLAFAIVVDRQMGSESWNAMCQHWTGRDSKAWAKEALAQGREIVKDAKAATTEGGEEAVAVEA